MSHISPMTDNYFMLRPNPGILFCNPVLCFHTIKFKQHMYTPLIDVQHEDLSYRVIKYLMGKNSRNSHLKRQKN